MTWEWTKFDERGLARFVTSEATNLIRLDLSRFDLAKHANERYELIKAIYNALITRDKKVRYAPEAYFPSETKQIIRTPVEILEAPGEGTCLDLAILFCGLCLGNELLPFLIILNGHALAAVSLSYGLRDWDNFGRREQQFFKDGNLLTDINELGNLIDRGDYLAIECTGFAQSTILPKTVPEGVGRLPDGFLAFERAIIAGREQLDHSDRNFKFALDIAIAHYNWDIKPGDLILKPFREAYIDEQVEKIAYGHRVYASAAIRAIEDYISNLRDSSELEDLAVNKLKQFLPDDDVSNREIRQLIIAAIKSIRGYRNFNLQFDFQNGELEGSDLVNVDLSNTNLQGVSFRNAFLITSDFGGSNLVRTDFSGAYVRNVNLAGAQLNEATLKNADWFNAIGLTAEQMSLIKKSGIIQCPRDSNGVFSEKGFIDYANQRYAFPFHTWSLDVQEQLIEAWQQYGSEGGLCELINCWRREP